MHRFLTNVGSPFLVFVSFPTGAAKQQFRQEVFAEAVNTKKHFEKSIMPNGTTEVWKLKKQTYQNVEGHFMIHDTPPSPPNLIPLCVSVGADYNQLVWP